MCQHLAQVAHPELLSLAECVGLAVLPPLRPTRARCRRLDGQHLACSWRVSHVRKATPLGRAHEERFLVRASERTSEAAVIEIDGLQHLATFP
jgi:hypothetical protein